MALPKVFFGRFPEICQFRGKIAKEWNLNLLIVKNEEPHDKFFREGSVALREMSKPYRVRITGLKLCTKRETKMNIGFIIFMAIRYFFISVITRIGDHYADVED